MSVLRVTSLACSRSAFFAGRGGRSPGANATNKCKIGAGNGGELASEAESVLGAIRSVHANEDLGHAICPLLGHGGTMASPACSTHQVLAAFRSGGHSIELVTATRPVPHAARRLRASVTACSVSGLLSAPRGWVVAEPKTDETRAAGDKRTDCSRRRRRLHCAEHRGVGIVSSCLGPAHVRCWGVASMAARGSLDDAGVMRRDISRLLGLLRRLRRTALRCSAAGSTASTASRRRRRR
jgi:hypothetical protein